MKIQNVIFDLDGTLLDTSGGIVEGVRYTIEKMGFHELEEKELLTFVGPPVQESFTKYFGCTTDVAQEAAEHFRNYYKNKALLIAKPYDGIYNLCDSLKKCGKKLAVATYKREDYALDLLKNFYFDEYFDIMHGADNKNQLTKKDIINKCMVEMDGSILDSVLIGDTEFDAKAANEMNVPFIGVTYGFGFKTEEDVNKYENIGFSDNPLKILSLLTSLAE